MSPRWLTNLWGYLRAGCPAWAPVEPKSAQVCSGCGQQLFGGALAAVNERTDIAVALFCSHACREGWRIPPPEAGHPISGVES